ncbi:MAG: class I SAM-dependent methyltransferase [Thermoanaerobaculia bacterium]
MTTKSAFDALAADYDASFSSGVLGSRLRGAVWRRLDAVFATGDRVLDLGCGTGEDAVHLARRGVEVVAVDRSPEMVAAARAKIEDAGLGSKIEVRRAAIEALEVGEGSFDGVVSNFGALNCVDDLGTVAEAVASAVRPRGRAVLCVMGPLVPWEWLWFLLRGQPRSAFRRLRRGGVSWRGITVRYPSIRELRRAFADFRLDRAAAVGALLPPSYAEAWAAAHPRLIGAFDRCERRLETCFPLPWLADHYLVELERLGARAAATRPLAVEYRRSSSSVHLAPDRVRSLSESRCAHAAPSSGQRT